MKHRTIALILACALAIAAGACRRSEGRTQRTFASPEDAVRALTEAVKKGDLDEVVTIFGPDGHVLVDSSDRATAERNREVFSVAVAEGWRLEDQGASGKTLVVGREQWPFPIPLVSEGNRWRFDTAAGREEVLARRIGRNELAVIRICRTYVKAQRLYARGAHDGQPAGLYATAFRSQPGKHDGLYWAATRGEKRSPIGDLLARAGHDGAPAREADAERAPFHGYYFRILTAQGADAPGGARDYMRDGKLAGGFALVAWPAQYDVTGVMKFIVGRDGVLYETDLGPETDGAARQMTLYNPDASWHRVE